MERAEVRERLAWVLRALAPEDLEDRVAPVKCNKHPDSDACGVDMYAVPGYGAPDDSFPDPEGGE
jgi:hypothetical protein